MSIQRLQQYTSFFSGKYQQAKNHVSKMMEDESASTVKQTLNHGIKKCASVVSDQLYGARSQVSKALNSEIVNQTKDVATDKFTKCKIAISNQCEEILTSEKIQKCKATLVDITQSETISNVKQNLQEYKTFLVNKCQESITKTSEIIESNAVKQGRYAIEEGLKTGMGVSCMYDLVLKLLPMTSPAYLGLEMVKYFSISFALCLASYKAYDQITSETDAKEELIRLEKEINELVRDFNFKQKELACSINNIQANEEMPIDKEKKSTLEAMISEILNSRFSLYVKSCIEGASNSGIYSYVIETGCSVFPQGILVKIIKTLLLTAVIAENILSAYQQNEGDLNAKSRLISLESKVAPIYDKLLGIDKEYFYKNQGETALPFIVEDHEVEKIKSRISMLAKTEPAIYLESLIGAATFASSIYLVLGKLPPQLCIIKYFFTLATLLTSAYISYCENKDKIKFQSRVEELIKKTENLQDLLFAVKIISKKQQNFNSFFKDREENIFSQEISNTDNNHEMLKATHVF